MIKMTSQEFEKIIQQKNLETTDFFDTDLSAIDLAGLNLSKSVLCCTVIKKSYCVDMKLNYCNMYRCEFTSSNFDNSEITNSDLRNANFYKCSLKNVSFRNSWLKKTSLKKCDLEGADFRDTVITGADFRGAKNIDKAKGLTTGIFFKKSRINKEGFGI